MIDKLLIVTDKCIELNKDNEAELTKYKLIKKILNKKDCFKNMSIDYAYSILRDLHIPENELKNVYLKLI